MAIELASKAPPTSWKRRLYPKWSLSRTKSRRQRPTVGHKLILSCSSHRNALGAPPGVTHVISLVEEDSILSLPRLLQALALPRLPGGPAVNQSRPAAFDLGRSSSTCSRAARARLSALMESVTGRLPKPPFNLTVKFADVLGEGAIRIFSYESAGHG